MGDIVVLADGTVAFDGTDGSRPTGAYSNLAPGGTGSAGDVRITAGSIEMLNEAQLSVSTFGEGDAGNVVIQARNRIVFDGTSVAVSRVEEEALGAGGNVLITTNSLEVTNGAQLVANTRGTGNAGNVVVQARDRVVFDGTSVDGRFSSAALSTVAVGSIGIGGQVAITTGSLEVTNGAQLSSSTASTGNSGDVMIQARDRVIIDGRSVDGRFSSAVSSSVEAGAVGAGGKVEIITGSLEVTNGAGLTTGTSGTGNAGNVVIRARDRVRFDNARALSSVAERASGLGGNVVITTGSLEVTSGAQLSSSTFGTGDAGNVEISARDRVVFDGTSADGQSITTAASIVGFGAEGTGGDVIIRTGSLDVTNGAGLTASTEGTGDAGNVVIDVNGRMRVTNGEINSFALATSGGRIDIRASNIILRENSNIVTLVGFGEGSGGNITIIADFVLALDDSDILAFSADGRGGNIDLSRTTFFGQNANIGSGTLTREELLALDGNDRVDINATGAVTSGQITVGDSSFIQNSLTQLSQTAIDTNQLLATSCIVRRNQPNPSSFYITGPGGLPDRPGTPSSPAFPTGEIRNLATDPNSQSAAPRPWQIGDPIQEPDGVYQLPNGELILSHQCR